MKLICFAPVQGGSIVWDFQKFPYHGHVRIGDKVVKGMGLFQMTGTPAQIDAVIKSGLVTVVTPITTADSKELASDVPVAVDTAMTTLLSADITAKDATMESYAVAVIKEICPDLDMTTQGVADPEDAAVVVKEVEVSEEVIGEVK